LSLVLSVNRLGRAFELDEQKAAPKILGEEQVGTLGCTFTDKLFRCVFLNGSGERLI
jgi:hypothetical protein